MSKLEVKEIGAISGETEVKITDPLKVNDIGAYPSQFGDTWISIRDPLKVRSLGPLDHSKESIFFQDNLKTFFKTPEVIFGVFGDPVDPNTERCVITNNSAVDWNYAQLKLIRRSNSARPRYIEMRLDGDNAASTTVGEFNGIWGSYTSAPTVGSTSAALSGEMHYGAYAGHKFYVNGAQSAGVDQSGTLFQVGDGTTMEVVNAQDMVDLLKGIKDAVNSQTTVEGMRSSLESVSDTLIAKYENKIKDFVEPEMPEENGENL